MKEGADDPGYPRYKKRDRHRSITYPQYSNGVVLRGNDLIVSKIGRIKVVWHRPVEGQIKTISLKRSPTDKRTVVLINPRNTSKMCSNPDCGKLVEKDLSVRVHECAHCGLVLDRDQNAAINILRLGLSNLRL